MCIRVGVLPYIILLIRKLFVKCMAFKLEFLDEYVLISRAPLLKHISPFVIQLLDTEFLRKVQIKMYTPSIGVTIVASLAFYFTYKNKLAQQKLNNLISSNLY